ncbi:glycosyltransferase family 4 protein [Acidiphilium sp.]|uniref:glycosyltransferase family 4 protein n=1 Tax=Acidiphilium sp. TaxID=527 RepID=UPI003CFD1B24
MLQTNGILSLPETAEILSTTDAPPCPWRQPTYRSALGAIGRFLTRPMMERQIRARLDLLRPDFAVCAMPAVLDRVMISALTIPYCVVVHDGSAHPGESLRFRLVNQQSYLQRAAFVVTLSHAVTAELRTMQLVDENQDILTLSHPPMLVGAMPAHLNAPFTHGGLPRILMFGRLLPYKGLDLLAAAMVRLGPNPGFTLRIAGEGPQSTALEQLGAMPDVTIERRWIPENELVRNIAWADAVILPYTQASQSGVAAAAIALGRHVIATNVGGLVEQLSGMPNTYMCDVDCDGLTAAVHRFMLRARQGAVVGEPLEGGIAQAEAAWEAMATAIRDRFVRSTLLVDPALVADPESMLRRGELQPSRTGHQAGAMAQHG